MNKIVYYTDGGCSGNPGPGGFGVIQLSRTYSQTMGEYIERLSLPLAYGEWCNSTTNNREELKAVIYALNLAAEDLSYQYEIYTDSAYVVRICNEWINMWAKNSWVRANGKPIENLDLIKELYNLLNIEFFMVSIIKCKGHNNILENELADAVASANMDKFDRLVDKNHIWVDCNPFIDNLINL